MAKVIGIINSSKKTGISAKTGKPWNIMTVELDDSGKEIIADSFDKLEIGMEVVVEYDSTYSSYKCHVAGKSDKLNEKIDLIDKKLDKVIAILIGGSKTSPEPVPDDEIPEDW